MIPTKGKGCEVTARNIATDSPTELARPLTTDPWDNAILENNGKTDTYSNSNAPKGNYSA